MRFKHGAFITFLISVCSVAAFAQSTSSITGTVHDNSGAVLPNANVVISNPSKGVDRPTVTNGVGDYLVAGLSQGTYNVTVTAPGFKKFEAKGVVLDTTGRCCGDRPKPACRCHPSSTVTGENVAQVETDSSELASTITSAQLSQLELNGRNFSQLVTLVPGVGNSGNIHEGAVGVSGNINFNMNGGRQEYNNWELDGGSLLDSGSNSSLNLYPSLDSISEVKVMTSNYSAQYGTNGSGTVQVTTK